MDGLHITLVALLDFTIHAFVQDVWGSCSSDGGSVVCQPEERCIDFRSEKNAVQADEDDGEFFPPSPQHGEESAECVQCEGVVSCSHEWKSGTVTVRPGDNITLCCYCNRTPEAFTVWFRNCIHENQPSLRLVEGWNQDHHFKFVKSFTSDSYDLLIMNATESDEGTYYCGTATKKVEDGKCTSQKYIYNNCNMTTKLELSTKSHSQSFHPERCELHQDGDFNWKLLLSVCSAVAVLSSLLASFLVYHLFPKTAKTEDDEQRCGLGSQPRETQGEDVCYAAVEICERSQRPKRMRMTQSSDFSTYSAIKTTTAYSQCRATSA